MTAMTNRLPLPVVLYLAAMLLPVRFMLGPLQMTSLRLYLAIIMIPLLIAVFREPASRLRALDLTLLTFVLWMAIAMAQTSPSQAIEYAGAVGLELLGGYFIARHFIRTRAHFTALIKLLVAIVAISLPLAIFEGLTGRAPLIELLRALPGLSSVAIVDIAPRLGLERAQVMFAHPIHYGLFASSVVALAFVGLRGEHPSWRILGLACGILGSFLALSSGAFLSVLLQLFLITWQLAFGPNRVSWWSLLALTVLCYLLIDLASNRSPVRVFFSYATFSAHNAYWRGIIFEWGMINVAQNPVFGIGLNEWVRPAFMRSGSMDNFWLVIAVRFGLPGFALLACAYFMGLIRIGRAVLSPQNQSFKRAWLICFVGLTFTLCTVHIWTSVFSYVFFLFGAGLWMLQATDEPAPASRPLRRKPVFSRLSVVPA